MVSWGPSPSPDICAGGKEDPLQGYPATEQTRTLQMAKVGFPGMNPFLFFDAQGERRTAESP